jgi:tungstate transport system ATP-binding protein
MRDSEAQMADRPSADAAPGPAVIELSRVTVRRGAVTVLADVDLTLAAGPPTLLMGPNGSGKTTLLHLMMGLVEPSEGKVALASGADGMPLERALVFQKPVMLRRTAAANIAFALQAAKRDADRRAVDALLDKVGLAALADRPARKLSGGEQQRLALARALARAPEVLLLDEPTASLDPAQTKMVEDIVEAIAAAGVKVVMATHDVGQARRLAGEVVLLVEGRIIEQTPAAEFFRQPQTGEARKFVAGELVLREGVPTCVSSGPQPGSPLPAP